MKGTYPIKKDSTRERIALLIEQRGPITIKQLHEMYIEKYEKISYVSIVKALAPLIDEGYLIREKENRREGKVSWISFAKNVKLTPVIKWLKETLQKNLKEYEKSEGDLVTSLIRMIKMAKNSKYILKR